MTVKSLSDYQREYENVIRINQPIKDILLTDLMTEMESQYRIPMLKNVEWEGQNSDLVTLYKLISMSRTL